jgi:hypothetical protein
MKQQALFAPYRAAMNAVQGVCIDRSADAILNPATPDRSIDAAATILLAGFREIEATLNALGLVETLIGVAPPRSKRVDRSEYLTFLVGSYLQEVYILDQRLDAYAKRIGRAYKGRLDATAVMSPIRNTLNTILRRRGVHVHESRYEDRRLGFLQGVAYVQHLVEGLEVTATRHYKRVQAGWHEQIKANNLKTLGLLESYFAALFSAVSQQGRLILPRTGKGPTRSIPIDA